MILARLGPVLVLLLGLAGCAGTGDAYHANCDHPIAAAYTEQCNPYLSRPGHD